MRFRLFTSSREPDLLWKKNTYRVAVDFRIGLCAGRFGNLDIGKIIILSEGVHPPELDQYPSVYKYQSSSDVIREVMECYGAEKKTTPQYRVLKKRPQKLLGVFSPLGRCLKTSFALDAWTDTGKR